MVFGAAIALGAFRNLMRVDTLHAGEPSMLTWQSNQTIRLSSGADPFHPYPHQTAAWDAMTRHFARKNEGMLVVPTGGGKTAIAARWLLAHHIRNGGRVLWLAHRQTLLRQAAGSFDGAASLSQGATFSRIVISSRDASWSNVSQSHQVVLSSIQSAATEANFGFLGQLHRQTPGGLFIVVDEAHHAAAPSYRKVLNYLGGLGCRLLGLSATPVRMDEVDEKRLWSLFHEIVYSVDKRDLISGGILSVPHMETVSTRCEFERDFTPEDTKHLDTFGELGQAVLKKIATHSARNALIVEHFLANRRKYEKTLVFAVDTAHAQTLVTEFKAQGVDADYVDYTRRDNEQVLSAYAEQDSPTVLTNVEMLTEGVDLPRTKTVFLVRPTRSEALLSQMIGRALRGPAAGGTSDAHLVTFVDTWKDFSPLDAEYVVNAGEVADVVSEPGNDERIPAGIRAVLPDLIMEAYRLVRSNVRGSFEGTYDCLPDSWYSWEAEYADDIQRRNLLVFSNQAEGFAALAADVATQPFRSAPSEEDVRAIVRQYWGDTQDPLPSWADIRDLLTAWKSGIEVHHYTFEEKKKFDPRTIADDFWARDLGERTQSVELAAIFERDPVCRHLYRNDVNSFREDVQRELARKAGLPAPPPPDVVAIIPKELSPWPEGESGYQLTEIFADVTHIGVHFPHGVPHVSDIRYAKKSLKTFWGFFRFSEQDVTVTPDLNSPDVPRFVLEFLVYHEVLHADMPAAGHDRNFRKRERLFKPSERAALEAEALGFHPSDAPDAWRCLADQFLDTLRLASMFERGKM